MLFLSVLAVTLFATAQTFAAATPAQPPSPSPSPGLPESSAGNRGKLSPILTVGNLTYYGVNITAPALLTRPGLNTTLPIPSLAKRCGSNAVGCDGGNVPGTDPCASLVYGAVDGNTEVLPDWVRAVCLNTSGQCCISWGAPTTGLRISTLFKAASKTYNACVVNRKSGYTRDTGLNGVCTDQCLSNRPDGCT